MAELPTIVVGRNNWGIKAGNLLGYYESDKGFFVKREFAVTRGGGTNGTFVGSNGLIQTAASGNLPRIDFYGGSPALLVEPAGTNLALRSEEFDNGNWLKTNASGLPNTSVAPNNTTTADSLVDNSVSGLHAVTLQSVGASGTFTFSVFAKADTLSRICFLTNSAVNLNLATNPLFFDLVSGTVVNSVSGVTGNIQAFPNGWYRCSAAIPSSGAGNYLIGLSNGGTTFSYSGTGQSLFIWGAQLETGSVATSYIPTTTGSVTRNADVVTLASATDYIGQTEGTLYAEFILSNLIGDRTIFEIGADNNNRIRLRINGSTISANAVVAGSAVGSISFSSQPTGVYKFAYSYAQNDFRAYLNGNPGTPVTSGNVPANMSTIGLGTRIVSLPSGVDLFNDRIIDAEVYNTSLSNARLAEITSDGSYMIWGIDDAQNWGGSSFQNWG